MHRFKHFAIIHAYELLSHMPYKLLPGHRQCIPAPHIRVTCFVHVCQFSDRPDVLIDIRGQTVIISICIRQLPGNNSLSSIIMIAGLDLTSPGSSSSQTAQSKRFGMKYLSRTNSSPLVAFATPHAPSSEAPVNLATKATVVDENGTGVVYDEAMLTHHCPCQDNAVHLENPSRIQVCL